MNGTNVKESGIKEVSLSLERFGKDFLTLRNTNSRVVPFLIEVHCLFQTWSGQGLQARITAYLRVRYLGGFLGQTAALCWDQVIVLSAHILIRVVQTSRTGSWWRPGQMEKKKRQRKCVCER